MLVLPKAKLAVMADSLHRLLISLPWTEEIWNKIEAKEFCHLCRRIEFQDRIYSSSRIDVSTFKLTTLSSACANSCFSKICTVENHETKTLLLSLASCESYPIAI